MPAAIKAIVFKTTRLKTTRHFFEHVLNLPIKESTALHFVIYSKGVRLVFVESLADFEVEMYISNKAMQLPGAALPAVNTANVESSKDPNGITVVVIKN